MAAVEGAGVGGPFDVFVCFAGPSGLAAAQALQGALAQAKISAFVDARDVPPVHSWRGVVRAALRDAAVTVVCLTPELALSVNAQAEVRDVIDGVGTPEGRRLIVPWVVPGAPQMTPWPPGLRAFQRIDGAAAAVVAAVVAWMGPRRPDPLWASAAGVDHFGRWAELDVAGAVQRLRWIKHGRFLMGSPEHEAGRDPAEGPAHEVTLTQGLWMADTPVTQALYRAVTGESPSRFSAGAAADRPVEQLSWDEAVAFTDRLAALLPPAAGDDGLAFQLPTEAQWEYACRAGATGPTSAALGQQRRDIAWFAKNSKGGTKPVGQLQPNAWGLYEMLGGVWEWCADARESVDSPYPGGPRVDPLGDTGLVRAVRGGAWRSAAHRVRAASRSAQAPTVRESFLGLRLSRGAPHRWPGGAAGG